MRKLSIWISILFYSAKAMAQNADADRWVDSVFHTLNNDQKIAQLMVVRLSGLTNGSVVFYDKEVEEAINKYNVGGICLFQGGPAKQAMLLNHYQSMAKTPILICIDGETGLGMRMLDSVVNLPRQMMLGAVQDPSIVYKFGTVVAEQCKRAGIQVNYAPVVDVNNNPDNPVINDRSFGEDKYRVANYGIQYMKALQDNGIMACAKHFPGHGDVAVDSHLDLPIIMKSREQLDSLELYPFRQIFNAGVGSVMVAHLSVPSIDSTPNKPTSISTNAVTNLLRNEMGFQGLTFTDALEMKGVAKYYPDGLASVESLIAGNDMLCLPGDVKNTLDKVKLAIRKKRLKWANIDMHVKKVLYAKYNYGLAKLQPIAIENIADDLNKDAGSTWKLVAENALTLLRNNDSAVFPLAVVKRKVAYVAIGATEDNYMANRLRDEFKAHVYFFENGQSAEKAEALAQLVKSRYDVVIIGVHGYSRFPRNNFGIGDASLKLIKQLQQENRSVTFAFGNPYAIKNFSDGKVIVACYDDNDYIQTAALDLLEGKIDPKGKLPVTVSEEFKYGAGITQSLNLLPVAPSQVGMNDSIRTEIDCIVQDGLNALAFPGAVVLVAKDDKIIYEKAFGKYAFQDSTAVTENTIYDLASVTKICATTLSVMKLYEEGKLDINKRLVDYLPSARGTNKENILVRNLLLHQAGLKAFIPFYKETLDAKEQPGDTYYSLVRSDEFPTRVAESLYLRKDFQDTVYKRMLQSDVAPTGHYLYSDNDFIFLGKIVEAITGESLDNYAKKTFYEPLGLNHTGFLPRTFLPLDSVAPTENEEIFRKQLLRGDVHDPGSAIMGGVAGHAGLFSDAHDMAVIAQLLLNGGTIYGKQIFKKETVDYFTSYQSNVSRRGLGFDKPERDNATLKEPYPCLSASPQTFGHTGFTGIGWWVDPKYNMTFIFLSNRVNAAKPNYNKLTAMSIRGRIQEALYKAMK
ncbi:glycoside hydrolase family 3 N-terminal domain-containing protein [Chitinophagaceae bacterium 26-R-25]|nr:glycoside hydrolase family 3 N-terminal domain-containing protein [Chitinophagaceae bacterium 26-R-25]